MRAVAWAVAGRQVDLDCRVLGPFEVIRRVAATQQGTAVPSGGHLNEIEAVWQLRLAWSGQIDGEVS